MRLKGVAVGIFSKIANDEKLLDLLEVPYTNINGNPVRTLRSIRNQIIENKYPNDLVTSNLSRLCIYELPTVKGYETILENCYIQIDIYVAKDKNEVDRRILLIAERIVELLNGAVINDYPIYYFNRNPDSPVDDPDWTKYGLIFGYNNIIL